MKSSYNPSSARDNEEEIRSQSEKVLDLGKLTLVRDSPSNPLYNSFFFT